MTPNEIEQLRLKLKMQLQGLEEIDAEELRIVNEYMRAKLINDGQEE